jgi:hypothetical protein
MGKPINYAEFGLRIRARKQLTRIARLQPAHRTLRRHHHGRPPQRQADLSGEGDLVLTLSGRNVDEAAFRNWIGVT